MLSCREVSAVCSAELDRPLSLGEQVSLRTHLMMCSACTNYRKQLKQLRQAAQRYAEGNSVSEKPSSDAPD